MTNNNPIETWTRKQCEEYLRQYPKSLKSEAVKKHLENLGPKPEPTPAPPKPSNVGSVNNVADVVGAVARAKDNTGRTPESLASKPNFKPQPKTEGPQKQGTGTSYVDEHEKGMAVVGKVILSVLAVALCLLLGWGITELFGVSYGLAGKVVSMALAAPLEAWIWKK